jgi:hypothetical protein
MECRRNAKGIFGIIYAELAIDFHQLPTKIPPAVHRFISSLLIVLALCATSVAQEKKRYVLYAAFLEATPVQLADGAKWIMDKGDTFPVAMFKEQQTKVVLQLAGTSFMTEASRVKTIEEKDVTPEQLATYRTNVQNYIDSQSERMKTELAK